MDIPTKSADQFNIPMVLHPSLEEVVKAGELDSAKLRVSLILTDNKVNQTARENVTVTDGSKTAVWKVPSLRALFRGDELPPPMLQQPPPAYLPLFEFVERHALEYCRACGDKTDGEFEEAYSNLRRRPDGKSFSELHFFLWQTAAGLLGVRVLSGAEFDAIFGRLARSASTFRMGLVSRNYAGVLRLAP